MTFNIVKRYYLLVLLILLPSAYGCSSSRDMGERRGLMLLDTHEMQRNRKMTEKRKSNLKKSKKSKKKPGGYSRYK
jgi:hypothetical protein